MLSLKLPKIDFQMNLQVKMNKVITRIKTNLLPMIMLLLAKEFNICDAPKALDLKEAGVTDFCERLRHAESEDRVGCLLPLVITVHSNLNGEPWGRKKRQ